MVLNNIKSEPLPHVSMGKRRHSDSVLLQMYVESNLSLQANIRKLKKQLSCYEFKGNSNSKQGNGPIKTGEEEKVKPSNKIDNKTNVVQALKSPHELEKAQTSVRIKVSDQSKTKSNSGGKLQPSRMCGYNSVMHQSSSVPNRLSNGNLMANVTDKHARRNNHKPLINNYYDKIIHSNKGAYDIESQAPVPGSYANITSTNIGYSATNHALTWMKRLITPTNTPTNGYNPEPATDHRDQLVQSMEEGILGRHVTSCHQSVTSDRVDIISENKNNQCRNNINNSKRNGHMSDHIWCMLEKVKTVLLNMYPSEQHKDTLVHYHNMA